MLTAPLFYALKELNTLLKTLENVKEVHWNMHCHDKSFALFQRLSSHSFQFLNYIDFSILFLCSSFKKKYNRRKSKRNEFLFQAVSGSSTQIKCDWSSREEGYHCFFHWHWKPHSQGKDFFWRTGCVIPPSVRTLSVKLKSVSQEAKKRAELDENYCMGTLTL